MSHPSIEKFGKLIVQQLRDSAMDHFDTLAKSHYKTPELQPLQSKLADLSAEQIDLVRVCVASAIDQGMHDFLFGLEEANESDEGIAVVVDAENVAELSDGLHGEPLGDNGWIAQFGVYDERGHRRGK